MPLPLGIELASAIPGASLVTLDTDSHIPLSREPATERIIECATAFLRSAPEVSHVQRRQVFAGRR